MWVHFQTSSQLVSILVQFSPSRCYQSRDSAIYSKSRTMRRHVFYILDALLAETTIWTFAQPKVNPEASIFKSAIVGCLVYLYVLPYVQNWTMFSPPILRSVPDVLPLFQRFIQYCSFVWIFGQTNLPSQLSHSKMLATTHVASSDTVR